MATRASRPRGLSANHVNEEERLQTIINDKSTLSSVRLLGKKNWVKMDERPNCFYCARKFRPFSMKRHCRSCGEIACSNCFRRRRVSVTPTLEVTVRLCFDCIDKAMLRAENEDLNKSVVIMKQPDANEDGTEIIDAETSKPDGKKTFGDSLQTTTTSTSSCSRFSEFSACDYSSDRDSDASDSSSLGGSGGSILGFQRSGRRGQSAIPATDLIEFLQEEEQLKIYDARRHDILTQLKVLDTEPEKEYDALCELVRQVFDCSVAAVAFMDQTRQWYKARYGIAQAELPRDIAFCSQLLQMPLPTIVMDATKDPRFSQNPLVTGSANIRFYASAPICDPSSGIVVGSVLVMDPRPKQKLPKRAMEVLSYVSSAAEKLLQGEVSIPAAPVMKQMRHTSTGHSMRRESLPPYPEIRTASLRSVPEDIEDVDFCHTPLRSNASSSSSNSSLRNSQRSSLRRSGSRTPVSASNLQPRHQSPDSNVGSTSSGSRKSSNTSNSKLSINDLVSAEPMSSTSAQEAAPAQVKNVDCIELFRRITSTQELLAQQHDTLLATLTQHSSRISSIEKTVDRIEGILSIQRTHSMLRHVDSPGRWPVDM